MQSKPKYYIPILYTATYPSIDTSVYSVSPVTVAHVNNNRIKITCQAVFAYGPSDPEFDSVTLQIEPGEILSITQIDDSGWCHAVNVGTGQMGWIPGNYVNVCQVEILDPTLLRGKL
jgi:SH3 domain